MLAGPWNPGLAPDSFVDSEIEMEVLNKKACQKGTKNMLRKAVISRTQRTVQCEGQPLYRTADVEIAYHLESRLAESYSCYREQSQQAKSIASGVPLACKPIAEDCPVVEDSESGQFALRVQLSTFRFIR